jgi:26S proteasome regulatory subunit N7
MIYFKFKSLIEEGGDWDRRNRLKVYHGLHAIMLRDFKTASKQFLDTVATFTSYELMDYDMFVAYTVFVTMLALPRPELRDKVCNLGLLIKPAFALEFLFFAGH